MKHDWKIAKRTEISKARWNHNYDEDVDYYIICWHSENREKYGYAYCSGIHRTVARIAKEIWKAADATEGYFVKEYEA